MVYARRTLIHRVAQSLAVLGLTAALCLGEEPEIPFHLPVPEGWSSETIPFPLEFAPELPYRGLEELRFAPGMFKQGDEGFWSYAFVWWIDRDDRVDVRTLESHLSSYYRGLTRAVGETRSVNVSGARVRVELQAAGAGGFSGTVETFDAFTTHEQVRLKVRGEIRQCAAQARGVVFLTLSPQPSDHPIWRDLESIRLGFRCIAPLATSRHFVFHSDPDVNLHHFLYQWSRHRDPDARWRLVEIPEKADLERLDEGARRLWQEALDFYRRELSYRHLFFDREMLELRYLLSEERRATSDERAQRLLDLLDRVRPVYLDQWWPAHDAANRAWLEQLLPALRAHEIEIAPRLAAAYGGRWPDERIRVDLAAYSNDVGAYASRQVVISTRSPGNAMPRSLEVLFHESSHYPSLEQPLTGTLDREFERQGAEAPARLWHLMMFYTSGELVRQAYAGAGAAGYVHYADHVGLYARRERAEIEALRRDWHAYLGGEIERHEALPRLVAAVAAGDRAAAPD